VKKRPALTASEFSDQLATNSDYQSGIAAQKALTAAIEAEAEPIIADLCAAGFGISSVGDLRRKYNPLPSEAVQILLKWLPQVRIPALQEAIARDLAYVAEPFDVRPLLAVFEQSVSESLRWAIANTLVELRPLDAREWVIEALKRRDYGRAREMLPLALARIAPREVANRILTEYLDEMPGHVALGLAESGGPIEADLLRRKTKCEKGWIQKELKRAIGKIDKRTNADTTTD